MPCNKKATFTKAKRIQYICINVVYIYMHIDISWTYIHIVRVGVLCMCSCRKRDGKVRGACKLQRVKSCKGKFLSNATISLAHTHTHNYLKLQQCLLYVYACRQTKARQGKARLNVGWLNLHSAFKLTFICHTTNSKLRRSAFFFFFPAHCVSVCVCVALFVQAESSMQSMHKRIARQQQPQHVRKELDNNNCVAQCKRY